MLLRFSGLLLFLLSGAASNCCLPTYCYADAVPKEDLTLEKFQDFLSKAEIQTNSGPTKLQRIPGYKSNVDKLLANFTKAINDASDPSQKVSTILDAVFKPILDQFTTFGGDPANKKLWTDFKGAIRKQYGDNPISDFKDSDNSQAFQNALISRQNDFDHRVDLWILTNLAGGSAGTSSTSTSGSNSSYRGRRMSYGKLKRHCRCQESQSNSN